MRLAPYALVTPARNEQSNLPRLAASVLAQSHRPCEWIIVDDGSDDGTAELIAELSAQHGWIRRLDGGAPDSSLADGRREARDLQAFRAGIGALSGSAEIVVKLDADLSFEPWYFRELIGRMSRDPSLGVASGVCTELRGERWEVQPIAAGFPWCASRAYRRDVLEVVTEVDARTGWDALDLVKARLRGYRTAWFDDLEFRHHRAWGGRERGRVQAYALEGQACWYMHYRPSYLVLRTVYRTWREPAAIGLLLGYVRAALKRIPTCQDREAIPALRESQRISRLLGTAF